MIFEKESRRLSGVFAPVITPFNNRLDPDQASYVRFCRWLLSQGVGLAIFGTNSEANSLSVEERIELFEALVDADLPMDKMMPGTGACSLKDATKLTRCVVDHSVAAVLMLPPFYYKGVSDEGIYAFYSEVIERVGSRGLQICLYHIPQVSGVAISLNLIEQLIKTYPDTVKGIKDSGGDISHTKQMLDAFPDFRVFCGSERFLVDTMRYGGAGCISAGANINPAAIAALYRDYEEESAEHNQRSLNAIRDTLEKYPMIAALKAIVATFGNRDTFNYVRPPLRSLDTRLLADLVTGLERQTFTMPGLERAFEG